MQINYSLKNQDYIDFNLYHLTTSKTLQRSVLLQRIIGPVIFLPSIFIANNITNIPMWYWTVIMTILSLAWVVFYPKRIEKEVKSKLLKMLSEDDNRALIGKQQLTINENGLDLLNEYETKSVNWRVFNKVEKTTNHIFIYDSSISAFIIPMDAFNTKEEGIQFLEAVKTKISVNNLEKSG